MNIYYYFDDKEYPIQVSEETTIKTKYSFLEDGKMWEETSMKVFFDLIDKKKQYNIIDIGAQSGSYSLFAKYLPNSVFYAFEPFQQSFQLLKDNIKLNNISNIFPFHLAISDKKGESILNTCKSHNGLHTLGNNIKRFWDVESIQIYTDTLDNIFFKNDIPTDFIKIDTEGHEYFILKGGINTIKKYKPIIQLEWNVINMEQCGITENMMNEILNEIGYKKSTLTDEEQIIIPI